MLRTSTPNTTRPLVKFAFVIVYCITVAFLLTNRFVARPVLADDFLPPPASSDKLYLPMVLNGPEPLGLTTEQTPTPTPTPFGLVNELTPTPTATPLGLAIEPSPTPTPFGLVAEPTATPFGLALEPSPTPTASPTATPKGPTDFAP